MCIRDRVKAVSPVTISNREFADKVINADFDGDGQMESYKTAVYFSKIFGKPHRRIVVGSRQGKQQTFRCVCQNAPFSPL